MSLYNEYITFRFNNSEEELLVPRRLLKNSQKIENLLSQSHDNVIHVNDIALSVFEDVIRIAQGQTFVPTESIEEMRKAAQYLELDLAPLEQKIQELLQSKIFPKD